MRSSRRRKECRGGKEIKKCKKWGKKEIRDGRKVFSEGKKFGRFERRKGKEIKGRRRMWEVCRRVMRL